MSMPPHPWPSGRHPDPPAPGLAQRLVARSGAVVYEGGQTMFGESVLVYLVRGRDHWAGLQVVDHVGRHLGSAQRDARRGLFSRIGPTTLFDPSANPVLTVRPSRRSFGTPFAVSGVIDARFVTPPLGLRKLTIRAGVNALGTLNGSGIRGVSGSEVQVLDRGGTVVGTIAAYRRWAWWSRAADYVVSIHPGLKGDLRRAVLAAPIVLANIRQAQKESSG